MFILAPYFITVCLEPMLHEYVLPLAKEKFKFTTDFPRNSVLFLLLSNFKFFFFSITILALIREDKTQPYIWQEKRDMLIKFSCIVFVTKETESRHANKVVTHKLGYGKCDLIDTRPHYGGRETVWWFTNRIPHIVLHTAYECVCVCVCVCVCLLSCQLWKKNYCDITI